MRRSTLAVAVAMILTNGVATSGVFANGRFPEAQRLLEHPGNADRLYLATTFGLLATDDHGGNWYSICEHAFALKLAVADPLLEVMPDGNLLGGLRDTLNLSSDCGCTWSTTLGVAAGETVLDIALDASSGAVLALVLDVTNSPSRSAIHESTDAGKTWRKLSDLPEELVYAFTVDVAPSDSSRVYVSGNISTGPGVTRGVLVVSSDHAATWETLDIMGSDHDSYPYIAAIDPADPDRVFVRTDESPNDALLYSEDAGQTWRELARRPAALLGFALSPDGGTVLIGYGGLGSNGEDLGIYRATAPALAFEKIFSGAISCLRWTGNGVYACITEDHPILPTTGIALGFAPNADFGTATPNPFASLLSLKNVRGPLSCTAALCLDSWKVGTDNVPAVCDLIRATCDVDPALNVLSCPAGHGTGGTGDGGLDGGGRAESDGSSDRLAPSDGSGACGGCRTSTDSSSDGAAVLVTVVAWISARGAVRRRRRSPLKEQPGSGVFGFMIR